MKVTLALAIASLVLVAFQIDEARGQALEYNFKDPKGINSAGISLDGKLEFIKGTASGISGQVTFDPKQPKKISGKIIVDTKSIQMTNKLMTKHLQGADWLDAGKFPTIEAVLTKVVSAKKVKKNEYKLIVRGNFTLKGKTKEIQIPVKLTFEPGKLKERNHKENGHLLVVVTSFQIDRHDFNIKPEMNGSIVSKKIRLDIGLVGYATAN